MKDETRAGSDEPDILKFYIWLMLGMTVVLAVLYWIVWSDVQGVRRNLAQGKAWTGEFAQTKREIAGMLKVYKGNQEDVARDAPGTWFSSIWRRKQIPDQCILPGAWKVPPDFNAKGKFYEERIEMTFNPRSPLTRQQIAEFCHEVEKSSSRLRVIELEVRRVDKEDFEKDAWSGKAVIGYRHARLED